jgi:hypothetical protein
VIFGAAALGGMKREKADSILDHLLEYGINTSTRQRSAAIRS